MNVAIKNSNISTKERGRHTRNKEEEINVKIFNVNTGKYIDLWVCKYTPKSKNIFISHNNYHGAALNLT